MNYDLVAAREIYTREDEDDEDFFDSPDLYHSPENIN